MTGVINRFYPLLLTSTCYMALTLAVLSPAQAQDVDIGAPPPPPLIDELAPTRTPPSMALEAPPADLTPSDETLPEVKAEKPVVKSEKAAPKSAKKSNKGKARASAPATEVTAPTTDKDRADNIVESLIRDDTNGASMSLTDALRAAYLDNPTLRAARAQVRSTSEQLAQARSNWQPTVDLDADVTHTTSNTDDVDTDSTGKNGAITLRQPIYRGGRTVAATDAAQSTIDAQLAILATTERQVLFQTAQVYMDLLTAQATVRVNEKNRDVIARQLRASRDRFRVGDVTRTDVSQSEYRLAQAEADVTAAIGNLRAQNAVFEQLVGALPGRLTLPKMDLRAPKSVDAAVDMAETYNPDVIAAMARHAAAKANVDVVSGELLPELALGAGLSASRDGGVYDKRDGSSVGLSLSMPLYEGGAVRSRVRAAKYDANELYMRILESRRAAREEAVRAWESLNAARAELKSREAQVRAAEIARNGVRQEADLGERTTLDALDADRDVRDAQIALLTAKRNEVVGQFAVASALGMLVPGNVGITERAFDADAYANGAVGRILSTAIDAEPETGK